MRITHLPSAVNSWISTNRARALGHGRPFASRKCAIAYAPPFGVGPSVRSVVASPVKKVDMAA